jgi:hypothetical protein
MNINFHISIWKLSFKLIRWTVSNFAENYMRYHRIQDWRLLFGQFSLHNNNRCWPSAEVGIDCCAPLWAIRLWWFGITVAPRRSALDDAPSTVPNRWPGPGAIRPRPSARRSVLRARSCPRRSSLPSAILPALGDSPSPRRLAMPGATFGSILGCRRSPMRVWDSPESRGEELLLLWIKLSSSLSMSLYFKLHRGTCARDQRKPSIICFFTIKIRFFSIKKS